MYGAADTRRREKGHSTKDVEGIYPEELLFGAATSMDLGAEKEGVDQDDDSSSDSKESSATRRHGLVRTSAENQRGNLWTEADRAVIY